MKKISYRLVYNRKKHLNRQGKALIQIEAYLDKQKIYFLPISMYIRSNGMTDANRLLRIRKMRN